MSSSLLLLLMVSSVPTFAARGVKQKRLLYDLADPLVTVTESTAYFNHPAHTLSPPSTSIYSAHSPDLAPIIKPLPNSLPPPTYHLSKPSLDSIYKSNYFEYSNYGSPFQFLGGNHLGFHDDDTYIADGRILKQYSVFEHHPEEVERNRLLHTSHHHQLFQPSTFYDPKPPTTIYTAPSQFTHPQFSHQFPSATIGFNPRFGLPLQQQPPHSPLLTKNHGPVALGSGSLGYIHGPNGIALGSGSLGYISHAQHRDTLSEILARKSRKHRPSPLHFGHNHD